MNEQFTQLHAAFGQYNSFVITSHVNPDGDSIGTEVALALYLKKKGKNVLIINQSETPDHLQFLTEYFPIKTYSSQSDHHILSAECFCVVDTNSPKRFSAMAETVKKSSAYKICIDHHLEQEPFADLYVIDTEVPASSELLYRIIAADDPNAITKPIADALYAGIMTDTGSFKFPKTDEETHTITADLLRRGVDPYDLYQRIYESGQINKIHLLGKALERIELHHHGAIATMTIPRSILTETGTMDSDVDNLTQYVLSIKGVRVGLVFIEQTDGVKISFRSKGDVAINTVAKLFGGGGHKNASGARMKNITLQDSVSAVIEKTKEIL